MANNFILNQGLNETNAYFTIAGTGSVPGPGYTNYTGVTGGSALLLPDAINNGNYTYHIKNSSTGTITIFSPTASTTSNGGVQTIDGTASTTITTGLAKTFYSNGANYLSY